MPFEETREIGLVVKACRSRHIYLMLLPVILFYIIYCYVPMYGVVLAWKE